ncbi:hypothetical protein F5051DRAFT_434333 [Lentinula edodes]|nr:hypothetical protein F5051DRAFT_434333 [Lentinula edodes]
MGLVVGGSVHASIRRFGNRKGIKDRGGRSGGCTVLGRCRKHEIREVGVVGACGCCWDWSGCSQGMTLPPLQAHRALAMVLWESLLDRKMPSSPRQDRSAASSSVPLDQGGAPPALSEDEDNIDQLAFTLDAPSHPQLEFFEKYLCGASGIATMLKILRFRFFARRCNQDLAYSRRFLELHGTPAQKASWAIPVDLWRRYDALLHQWTSSTTALLELNMLDEGDDLDRDHQELSQFIDAQRQEAVVASKRKRASSPSRLGESTSSGSHAKTSRKRHRHLSPPPASLPVIPRLGFSSQRSPHSCHF